MAVPSIQFRKFHIYMLRLKCFWTQTVFRWLYEHSNSNLKIQTSMTQEQTKISSVSFKQYNGNVYYQWAKYLLHWLIKYQFVRNEPTSPMYINLAGKILEAGFDIQGNLLQGLTHIGLSGVQLGPVSFKEAEDNSHLGILISKANIQTYFRHYVPTLINKNNRLKIGIQLLPDAQVIQYTPYIIKQNLLNALNLLLQKSSTSQSISNLQFITLNTSYSQQQVNSANISKNAYSILIQDLAMQSQKITADTNIKLHLLDRLGNTNKKTYTNKTNTRVPINSSLDVDASDPTKQDEFISWKYIVEKIIE